VINSISPSSINAFDETTSFGCQRRWWYKYVEKREEPKQAHLERGVRLHALIESYLKGTLQAGEGEEYGLFLAGQHFIDAVKPHVIGIEAPVKGEVAGIPISSMSKCDAVLTDGIVDWKTSSDIRRYGKTPADLAKDTQLNIYARAFHPTLSEVRLAHVYFQTSKGKRAELVETVVTKKHLDEHYANVIVPLVQKMKLVSEVQEAASVKPNLEACRMCPHAAVCPQDKKENAVVSFFNRFKQVTTQAPITPSPTEMLKAMEPQPILPPDAPKSDPATAAVPVEGFSPIPPPKTEPVAEERKYAEVQRAPTGEVEAVKDVQPQPIKRKPGRPPGAKNKPKMQFVDVPSDVVASVPVAEPKPLPAPKPNPVATPNPKGFTVTSVTFSKGMKVGLPNYSSIDFQVSMTAEGEDYEATLAALKVEVEKRLSEEFNESQQMKALMKADEKAGGK
jgi:hypothetical protein